jgi:hypothetical protein
MSKLLNSIYESLRSIPELVNTVTWEQLSVLGKSHFIRSFSLWFILIPLIAKILSEIQSVATIRILVYTFTLHLQLPFSWAVFYFCSLAFALANTIFALRCPPIVKKYSSYGDFRERDNSVRMLKGLLQSVVIGDISRPQASVDEFTHEFATNREELRRDEDLHGWQYDLAYAHIESSKIAEAFAWIFRFSNTARRRARVACTISYAMGIALFIVVLIQNIFYVAEVVT